MTLLKCEIKSFALTFAFLFIGFNETIFAQKKTLRFNDYSVAETYKGKTAPLKLTRADKMFRTRLKWAVQNLKPNFAGHYILTTWGCGAECLMGAVIDAQTGKVSWWNSNICCWSSENQDEKFQPIEFRGDSKLIIFSGYQDGKDSDKGTHYYEFKNGRFVHLQSVLSEESP